MRERKKRGKREARIDCRHCKSYSSLMRSCKESPKRIRQSGRRGPKVRPRITSESMLINC